jgi:hypothetical protein
MLAGLEVEQGRREATQQPLSLLLRAHFDAGARESRQGMAPKTQAATQCEKRA